MITKKLLLFFASASIASSIQASTVTLSGSSVFESDGITLLDEDSYVSIGYFANGFDFSSITSSLSWSDLNTSSYTEIIGESGINPAGTAGVSVTKDGIFGESLYVWFFDTLNTPNIIAEQEFGLFSSTNTEWIGNGDGVLDFNNLLIGDIDIVEFGSIEAAGISLTPVPEPSTYALFVGVLAIGYIVIRRLRS